MNTWDRWGRGFTIDDSCEEWKKDMLCKVYDAILDALTNAQIALDYMENSDSTISTTKNGDVKRGDLVKKWFKHEINDDKAVDPFRRLIYNKIGQVIAGFKQGKFKINCVPDEERQGCVTGIPLPIFGTFWGKKTINLGVRAFDSQMELAATIIHELFHMYAGAKDMGYYDQKSPFSDPKYLDTKTNSKEVSLMPEDLLINPDTYAYMIESEFFVVQPKRNGK